MLCECSDGCHRKDVCSVDSCYLCPVLVHCQGPGLPWPLSAVHLSSHAPVLCHSLGVLHFRSCHFPHCLTAVHSRTWHRCRYCHTQQRAVGCVTYAVVCMCYFGRHVNRVDDQMVSAEHRVYRSTQASHGCCCPWCLQATHKLG